MGNTGSSRPTPEDKARKLPRSDFDNHPSLTPIETVLKKPLPGFVPIMTVPEGHVHKLARADACAFGAAGLESNPDEAYVFQPNRTLDHISGRETKIRYVRHFGAPQRRGKLYFLRSRTVERKEDASPEERLLAQLLDEIKAQNKAFTTLEAEQMRQVERALEEMVGVVSEQLRAGTSKSVLEVRIKNALKSGETSDLMHIIVSQWLTKVKNVLGDGQATGPKSRWGTLKTSILRSKPWLKSSAKSPASQADQFNESLDYDDDISDRRPVSASSSANAAGGGGGDKSARLSTPDSDDGTGLGDTLLDLGDTLGDTLLDSTLLDSTLLDSTLLDSTLQQSTLGPAVEEEHLELDEVLLEDFLQDLSAAEPDFDRPAAIAQLQSVFVACAEFLRLLYGKYAVADERSPTGQSVSVVQFQIFVLEVNCAIEEREAKDVFDSLCGFDWDKAPKKIMQLNIFAHALVRAASLYLENIMSQSGTAHFTDFNGTQVASHLLELLRHCSVELDMGLELPDVDGVDDIRLNHAAAGSSGPVMVGADGVGGHGVGSGEEADADGAGAGAAETGVDPAWRLKSSFRIDSAMLEDLCEEVEDPAELQQLLGELYIKTKELQRIIIEQFAVALRVDAVDPQALDQYLDRDAFIEHAATIDSLIDAETSDDVYSQLCGYPFEKVQKPMDLHLYAHAFVRLANLYSMFSAPDGTADFIDIITQMDFLAERLKGGE